MIHGGSLKVTVAGVTVALAKSCNIQYDCEMIEVATQAYGTFREYIAGRKGWSVEVSGLVSSVTHLLSVGTSGTLTVTDGTDSVTGTAICSSWKMTGTIGNLAQQSCLFQGTGPLSSTAPGQSE